MTLFPNGMMQSWSEPDCQPTLPVNCAVTDVPDTPVNVIVLPAAMKEPVVTTDTSCTVAVTAAPPGPVKVALEESAVKNPVAVSVVVPHTSDPFVSLLMVYRYVWPMVKVLRM